MSKDKGSKKNLFLVPGGIHLFAPKPTENNRKLSWLDKLDFHEYIKYIGYPILVILTIITIINLFLAPSATIIKFLLVDNYAVVLLLTLFILDELDRLEEKMGLKKE